ncbi:FAD-dependent oxidoreductase [Crateriforma spongiae]|uniref:FAD-dependent oxidoreductase n=1 Tax=Crateriforma spongiae TaxID=2724528 RepID=UPI001445468A|nr:FAD-dependent oxidoreductase [Crateriforma spongiae]
MNAQHLSLSHVFRLACFCSLVCMTPPAYQANAADKSYDVVVYGGTPAGIAAAVESGRDGATVLIVEPNRYVGGMLSNGLCHADFRTFEGLTGSYLELTKRIRKFYRDRYGANSAQALGNFRGTHAEPSVNRQTFEGWLNESPNIQVMTQTSLHSATTDRSSRRLSFVQIRSSEGRDLRIHARHWIDASYEGDLMAASGCAFDVGQEATDTYGESLAPQQATESVQGYNFRLVVTNDAKNQIETPRPKGYDRNDFTPLLDLIQSGRIDKPFCMASGDPAAIFKAQEPPLPNAKYDVNDVSNGRVRLSLPQISDTWPADNRAERDRLFDEHLRHQIGLLYFVQNDVAVPDFFRRQANQFKLCADEFTETNGIPDQLYVREGRRMVGRYIFTEKDVQCGSGLRAKFQSDAIAMGDYGPNCHGTDHDGPRIGGRHRGEFYKRCPPYQIPIGVLQPRELDNLLVPVACSASHVGFCALRLEPIWMSLGQAAGVATRIAVDRNVAATTIDAVTVRKQLHRSKAATIYISDVREDDENFGIVQAWGSIGGFHHDDHSPQPADTCGTRGDNIIGQYYEAFPGHTARLDETLSRQTRQRWESLAKRRGIKVSVVTDSVTRGEWLRLTLNMGQTSAKTARQ